MPKPTPALIGTDGAAEILDRSDSWVRANDALLSPMKLENGRRVYRRDEIERIAAELRR